MESRCENYLDVPYISLREVSRLYRSGSLASLHQRLLVVYYLETDNLSQHAIHRDVPGAAPVL